MIEHQLANSSGNYHYNAYIYTSVAYPPHFHSSYELIYVIYGSFTFSLDGTLHRLKKGELYLIPPYRVHSFSSSAPNKVWIGVFFEDFIHSFATVNKFKKYGRFNCRSDIDEFLNKELFFQGTPEHYMLISCLYMVCNECIKNATCSASQNHDAFINKTILVISENLSENINMLSVSRQLGYEYHYFSKLFNDCFSTNFKNFINIFQFQKACSLLSDKSNSITDVCAQCGFGSIRNFNRIFKVQSKYTPSEYRTLILQKKTKPIKIGFISAFQVLLFLFLRYSYSIPFVLTVKAVPVLPKARPHPLPKTIP